MAWGGGVQVLLEQARAQQGHWGRVSVTLVVRGPLMSNDDPTHSNLLSTRLQLVTALNVFESNKAAEHYPVQPTGKI